MKRSKKALRRLLLASCVVLIAILSDWLAKNAVAVEFPTAPAEVRLYSNQTGNDLHLLFCEALAQAKRSIFLEMYAVTDPSVLALLKNQAARGKHVAIHADKKASGGLKKKIPVDLHQGKGLMHRKVVVLDDDLVFLGSANFTTASLKMHDNLVLAAKNSNLAHFCKSHEPPWIFSDRELTVWKFPESGKEGLDAACAMLAGAQKSIRVAMFTFTHMRLAQELIAAKNRGVDVRVAIDRYTREGSSKKVADLLETSGIPLYVSQGIQLLHHKWALIDGTLLLAGSANWTKSAFMKNKEILFSLSPLNESQKKKMDDLWKEIAVACY